MLSKFQFKLEIFFFTQLTQKGRKLASFISLGWDNKFCVRWAYRQPQTVEPASLKICYVLRFFQLLFVILSQGKTLIPENLGIAISSDLLEQRMHHFVKEPRFGQPGTMSSFGFEQFWSSFWTTA